MSKEIYTDLENKKLNGFNNGKNTIDGIGGGPGIYSNFFQVIPNSQIFTTIEQLLEYSKYKDEYLHQGIKNSIKQGYKLVKITIEKYQPKIEL